ncbi:hypothetical protein Gpo141_00006269 [Globisporangium polare]
MSETFLRYAHSKGSDGGALRRNSVHNANASFAAGENFFTKDLVVAALVAKLIAPATAPPVPAYTCTRCALKERWTIYSYEVDIDASLKTESTDTAAKLQINTSLPEDNIYVALGCPTYLIAAPTPQPFDSAYRAKVSDMLAVAAPVSIRRIVSGTTQRSD